MAENSKIELPASGLAEDILAQFVTSAQSELDKSGIVEKALCEDHIYHLVTFTLAEEEYGVEIGNVQEIIRATDITPVPGAPDHIRGVINLRGKIIPVVDLRKRFNLPTATAHEAQRIVVVELVGKRLGMLVDGVSQVIKVHSMAVEEMPEEATTLEENYIRGIGKLDNRLVIILDLNRSLLLVS